MSTIADDGRELGRSSQDRPGRGGATACPSCDGEVPAGARICRHCGRSLDGAGWLSARTLAILAAAAAALITLGAVFSSVIDLEQTSPGPSPRSAGATAPAGQPPDLSTMSPRAAADRLFNRVMMADERGDADEVAQFAPMAIAAYEQLDSLDTDALYHMALIQAASGEFERARDVVARIEAAAPHHLLALALAHRLAEQAGNRDAAARAASLFHEHYDEELATDRPEYRDHRASLERFRSETSTGRESGR